ncbi:uncharacterized protein ColSpa_06987 [Colletotrichum spaethianum]|uniref:N-acetyltransferase domain-containing protein n=1 Tax=Colletotrichum spaethianum TaxID=700344 RepID=A0AA37P6M4_9PEZI|nr:uncharacterized protein ColSpa_06987 [Colletotrichum spaethianum]GKT46806.1 hypothetical protein ColSpa_06987 [Colletotrichum spaethianum]
MAVSTPKQGLSIRPATPADVPVLLPLIRSAYRGEFSRKGWTTEADLLADQRIDEAGLLAKITEPEGVVLLVVDPSAPATALSCCEVARSKKDPAVAYFGLFAVDPERQAGGVGRAVLAHAEAFAAARWGVVRMEIGADCVVPAEGYGKTGERREFPYKELVDGKALRDDLWFEVLEKEL